MKVRTLERFDVTQPGRMADLVELAKPSITLMVLVTTATGFLLAAGESVSIPLLLWTLLGTGLLSAGGSALNHVMERDTDALMERTSGRPLPSGRLGAPPAALYGSALSVAGALVLAGMVNLLTAGLGLLAMTGYVFVYTPLKRVTWWSTIIGAVPGAIPPLMGWTAARDALEAGGWVLFGILFCWQLPHFLAIAWL